MFCACLAQMILFLPIKNKIVMILENLHGLPSQMYVRLKSFFAIWQEIMRYQNTVKLKHALIAFWHHVNNTEKHMLKFTVQKHMFCSDIAVLHMR